MTKGETISLYNNLQKLGNLKGVKFAYARARNISLVKPEIEALEKALEASDEFKKYDEERVELAKEFAKKDEKGNPVKVKNAQGQEIFDGLENNPEWELAFEALKEENKEVLEARDEQVKEQNELLKTASTLQLYKVALSDVPADISGTQMEWISEMVSEDMPTPYPVK